MDSLIASENPLTSFYWAVVYIFIIIVYIIEWWYSILSTKSSMVLPAPKISTTKTFYKVNISSHHLNVDINIHKLYICVQIVDIDVQSFWMMWKSDKKVMWIYHWLFFVITKIFALVSSFKSFDHIISIIFTYSNPFSFKLLSPTNLLLLNHQFHQIP